MYLLTTVLFGVGMLFWAFDGHTIVKETVCDRWRKFRQVNQLVAMKYKNIGMIVWVSIQLIAKMYWMNFVQWANNTIRVVDKRTTAVSYVIGGKMYTIVVKNRRGPSSVLLVMDEDNEDVSKEILPYMGPSEDWHKRVFTPSFWNKKKLTFELSSGETKTFDENQIIDLVPSS